MIGIVPIVGIGFLPGSEIFTVSSLLITLENRLFRNGPFYLYGGYIELIFLKFSQNNIVMGKEIVVPCLDVMIAVFQRDIC